MGLLVDGVWRDDSHDPDRIQGGRFVRRPSPWRSFVTPDGSAGPSGDGGFPAEAGRYHLYVSLGCPWAHRTVIYRAVKRLENVISMSLVSWRTEDEGWTFDTATGSTGDAVNGTSKLYEVYLLADPKFTGRITVPVLWDKQRKTIVSNESSEIIRMLNSAFDAFTDERTDYYPAAYRAQIDELNDRIYTTVNNGVYRAGFATTQEAYEEAARGIFATLDELEHRLAKQRYLCGPRITEADWRLFPTLIRFDTVYYSHFKCNLRRIQDYPNLWGYLRDLYQTPGVADTVSFQFIKQNYYGNQVKVNPTRIVPIGPVIDFSAPHDRDRFLS
jgi:glutathionyl-hydroquinone reductase